MYCTYIEGGRVWHLWRFWIKKNRSCISFLTIPPPSSTSFFICNYIFMYVLYWYVQLVRPSGSPTPSGRYFYLPVLHVGIKGHAVAETPAGAACALVLDIVRASPTFLLHQSINHSSYTFYQLMSPDSRAYCSRSILLYSTPTIVPPSTLPPAKRKTLAERQRATQSINQ